MPQQSTGREVFSNRDIHDIWTAAYRASRRQEYHNQRIYERLLRRLDLPSGATILDAGCGTATHTGRFAARGYRCVGIDISQHAVEIGRHKMEEQGHSNVEFFCGSIDHLDRFQDGQFDAVHCRGVLMHIENWKDALSELCRVVAPAGKLVLFENSRRSLESRLVQGIRRVRKANSDAIVSEEGILYRPTNGVGPIWRTADLTFLRKELARNGVQVIDSFGSEFWDIGRFPDGMMRDIATFFNRRWFDFRLPSALCVSHAIVGVKK
jgi:SAM-dependent methyltransferase